MLLGETGTGKEITARAVHALSKRPGAFVAINCGAIPAALVEGQLFGHVKGAFSGAVRDEPGLVRAAQFGTLFLDEIGDLPAASQAALLRVLQEGEVLPVGATRAMPVDIRVVCATHRPLDDLMSRGDFRRDLYGRLAGFSHTIPPLRDRRVDLGLIVAALLRSGKVRQGDELSFRPDAARAMVRYDWPLNVRELAQCLATAGVLAEQGVIRLEDLPQPIAELAAAPPSSSMSVAERVPDRDEAVRRELLARLAETGGNMSEVARAMGKARQQVQRWVRRFGIDPDAFRGREK
jgi:transcriptional regulator with GAF, ATPase, and Fis domain